MGVTDTWAGRLCCQTATSAPARRPGVWGWAPLAFGSPSRKGSRLPW
jgi:hypothetical protein